MSKRFVLTADELGLSKALCRGVLEGYDGELLKSVSVVANGEVFDESIGSVLSQCDGVGVGIQLNLTRGNSLCSDLGSLTDANGKFNNSFWSLFLNIYNPKEKELLANIEREFRRQIEKVLSKTKPTHLCSIDHIHEIPKIFNLVCRLAKEYNIKYVRSNYEKLYIIPDVFKHLKLQYLKNILKTFLLNFLTIFNEVIMQKYGLKTNDYFIGGIYNNMSDSLTVSYGVSSIKYNNVLVECSVKPCRYDEGTIDNHFNEFLIIKNKKLKEKLLNLGFEITNYVEEED